MTMQTGTTSTASSGRDIITIGGSAGGMDAMVQLFRQLPASLPAALFIAYHLPPEAKGVLHNILGEVGTLKVKLADDGEPIRRGIAYVARPDRHLLIEDDTVRLRSGPRENRWRPAIDSLFRSAAVAYGPRVIGVVLSGMLDDGTAGLAAIKRCGGITVVQDPRDAAYPDMPQSALDNVAVDRCVAVSELGALLEKLTAEAAGATPLVPDEVREESRISFSGSPVSDTGDVHYTCPDCGGPLQRIEADAVAGHPDRYRCVVGHLWSPRALLSNTTESLEQTIWAAIRLFRQRSNLLASHAKRERSAHRERLALHHEDLMREALAHAQRLQELVLKQSEPQDSDEEPAAEPRGQA